MRKLVLYDSTFLWVNNQYCLFYNYVNGAFFRSIVSDPDISNTCSKLLNIDNLYTVAYNESSSSVAYKLLINNIIDKKLGYLVSSDSQDFAFPPFLKINHSIENKRFWGSFETQPVLPNLMHICVFMGGKSDENNYYKQTEYPFAHVERLAPNRLYGFLKRCDAKSLRGIDLIFSDLEITLIEPLVQCLSEYKDLIHIYFAQSDPSYNNGVLETLSKDGYVITQVCLPNEQFKESKWAKGRSYQLLVRSEEEVEYWEAMLGDNSDVNYELKPIADNNSEFFRKNVFLSEEEILSQKLTKKDIFRHQVLNLNQFGTLYIFPDGTIHSAAYSPAIGTLEDSVHQTIIRELEENHAWRQTRRINEPCNNCIYQDLCPSPSVYEKILGMPGCTYWKE